MNITLQHLTAINKCLQNEMMDKDTPVPPISEIRYFYQDDFTACEVRNSAGARAIGISKRNALLDPYNGRIGRKFARDRAIRQYINICKTHHQNKKTSTTKSPLQKISGRLTELIPAQKPIFQQQLTN